MAALATREASVLLRDVTRRFGRRTVFSAVSGEAHAGQSLVISGANGSGKSTLVKIIAGLLGPSGGEVDVRIGGKELDPVQRRRHIGYVAPDLALYAELTGAENLQFFGRLRGIHLTRDDLIALLTRVGLRGRGRDYVGDYSSGMRQRLKYAVALLHNPALLLLDEPTANLDAEGAAIVKSIVDEQKRQGLVLIATNEAHEVAWGDAVVRLTVPQ
jgi:heme exporter protein A